MSFRQKLLSANQCRFDCVVTADFGEQLYSFLLNCSFDQNGTMTFSVQEPEYIRGITGTIEAAGGKLTFDNRALAFSLIADGYISPVSAPWVFMKALRSGYIHSCGSDGDGYRISIDDSYEEHPLQLQIRTDGEYTPTGAEFLWKGKKVLSLTVSNYSCL